MPSGIWRGDFTTTNCGREDPALQALSLAAMIPIGGQAATASKLAGKVGEPLLKNMDKADEVAGFLGRYKDELAEACEELACFPAGTPVLTPLGYVPIEQLRKGDFILSRPEDDVNAPVTHQKVEVAYIREAEVLELTIGGRSITTTAEHPFWVRGFGWTPAAALEADDELATADGSWIRLDTIRYTGRHTTVFNIRVQEDHTYFVGSPEWGFAVWVHNTHIGLPNESLVVRGGLNTTEQVAKGIGKHPSGITGVSVHSAAGKSIEELAQGIPNGMIGTTTVGAVREAGGDVITTSGRSVDHATLTGLTAQRISELLQPVIKNPARG